MNGHYVTTTGRGLVTSTAELLFTYLRVDRMVEVIGISSQFKVGSWNGDACRVLTVSCLLLLGELGLNTPTVVSSYNSMGTTDSSSIISLSYQLISVCFTGTPCSQAVRVIR